MTTGFAPKIDENFRNYSAGVGQSPSSPASKRGEIPISPDKEHKETCHKRSKSATHICAQRYLKLPIPLGERLAEGLGPTPAE
jgi:hypothetical protein